MSDTDLITRAFYDAQKRRPYPTDAGLVEAITPSGGEWTCALLPDADSHTIRWGSITVATVNPEDHLDMFVAADIAMALRATPVMDAALRAILVLAESHDNLDLIRRVAISVIAHVEAPAPRRAIPVGSETDDEEPT